MDENPDFIANTLVQIANQSNNAREPVVSMMNSNRGESISKHK